MAYDPHYTETLADQGRNWWKKDNEKDIYLEVQAYIKFLETEQSYRSSDNLRHARLYGNYEMLGLDSYSYTRAESSYNVGHRVTLNIIQSIIDTVVSKITKNKPKPTFLTSEGSWDLQEKAKKMTKFIEGVFYGSQFYRESTKAFKDSCIFGTGVVKFIIKDNEITAERVFIDEIKIDDTEGFYGQPRQLHQVKYIHRDVLKEKFPDHQGQIDAAIDAESTYSSGRGSKSKDMIMVVESWHLPSGKTKDEEGNEIPHDGKHAITISNATLMSRPYSKNYFPFIFFRWTDRPVGFFGQGISEQLQGIQMEINKVLRTIEVSSHLTSIPKVFVEASSKVVTAHLNNKIGGIIKYAGTKPSYESVGTIPQELFNYLQALFEKAYEISGVSQLSAQSNKPAGLDSGKALREFSDIETERFLEVATKYEESFIQSAKIIIDMAKDVYQNMGEFSVKVAGDDFLETIDWKEINLPDDKYAMKIFPTSALSSTPAGKLQDVQELLQAGLIDAKTGLKLLDFPDLKSALNMINADQNDIEKTIYQIMHKNNYMTPEPYQNLELGIAMFQQAYLMYRSQNAPESKLELLRRWMEEAKSLLDQASQPEQLPPENPVNQAQPSPEQPLPEAPIEDLTATLPPEEFAAQQAVPTEEIPLEATEQQIQQLPEPPITE